MTDSEQEDNDEPEFKPFLDKNNRLVTTKTASLSMNHHGRVNIPGSVRSEIFDDAEYVQFHVDHDRGLLAFEPFPDEDSAPANAYKLSGEKSGSASVEKVLEWAGYEPPESHTMFELKFGGGFPYIDLAKLNGADTE